MRNPTREDLKYEHGFPANISGIHPVAFQVVLRPNQSVVLYTCKVTGKQTASYQGYEISDLYPEGLYWFE